MAKSNPNISDLRGLHPGLQQRFDNLINDLIQHHLIGSTLVEGSTFTEEEALRVLSGNTIHGHTVDEHQELLNGRDTASFIHRLFFQRTPLDIKLLDQAHGILFNGVGNPKNKNPGKNRGATSKSAFTVVIKNEHPVRISYETPSRVKTDYQPYVEYHLNRPLPREREEAVSHLAKLYFHFELLHPYNDGNGRLGRLLVNAKAVVEKGWLFRFELKDGPEHLRIMISQTLNYIEKKEVDYTPLEGFLDEHLKDYD